MPAFSAIKNSAIETKKKISSNKKEFIGILAGIGTAVVAYKSRKFFTKRVKKAYQKVPYLK